MRICLISHAHVEHFGYLPVLTSIAAQPGVELALVTPDSFQSKHISMCAFEAARPAFQTFPVGTHFGNRQGAFVYRKAPLDHAIDTFRPDILLHEQEVYALSAGQIARLAKRRGLPLVMFVWENVDRELSAPRRLLSTYVMERCAGLVAGSSAAAAVHASWGFQGCTAIIPQMGVASVATQPEFGRRDRHCLRVAFAGRLIQLKGIDCLLRSVATLRDQGIPVHCTIAGNGPEREALEQLTRSLQLSAEVTFAGALPINKVARLLAESDVLVLPSRRSKQWEEQFGRILVEAMAQATVAVGTRTGAIREVLGTDELVFEQDDIEALAALLSRLSMDEAFLTRLQHQLWERAQTRYLNGNLASERIAFLAKVLSGDHAG